MRKKIFLQLILVGLMLLGYQQVFAINKPPSCSSTPTQGSKTSSVAHGHCLTHHPRTSVKGSSRRSARTKGSRVKKPLPTADHLLRTAIRSSSTLNPRLRLRQARRGVRATVNRLRPRRQAARRTARTTHRRASRAISRYRSAVANARAAGLHLDHYLDGSLANLKTEVTQLTTAWHAAQQANPHAVKPPTLVHLSAVYNARVTAHTLSDTWRAAAQRYNRINARYQWHRELANRFTQAIRMYDNRVANAVQQGAVNAGQVANQRDNRSARLPYRGNKKRLSADRCSQLHSSKARNACLQQLKKKAAH